MTRRDSKAPCCAVANPEKRRSMGRHGRELASKYFDMEQNALKVLNKMKDLSKRILQSDDSPSAPFCH